MAADHRKLDALRRYLRRKKTLTELRTLADTIVTVDADEIETIFTSAGFASTSSSATLRGIDRLDLLGVIEELIAEMVTAGVTSWTEAQSGKAATLAVERVRFDSASMT